MEARCRRARESSSPDRAKTTSIEPRIDVKRIKKVQVFYYLTRNGHLEQPHLIEVTHFANQPLRLRDVMDRLTVLRGKAMPSLYSWSCKRNYRSGYVWNDLSENDIVYPAEGAEYVLKGSEIVGGSSEKLQRIHVSNRQLVPESETNVQGRTRKPVTPSPLRELEDLQDYEEYDEVEAYEYEDGEKTGYTSSTTPHSRCSRGVSTEELEEHETRSGNQKRNESTRIDLARLSTSTAPPIITKQSRGNDSSSLKRFTDNDQLTIDSPPSRNSVLLQFIACGSSTVAKAKSGPSSKESSKDSVRKSESLQKEVARKIVGKQVGEEDMINYISENPRFGNLQSEEKEYFSGSIIESMRDERHLVEPTLKKSNSYNEEMSKRAELEGTADREEKRKEAADAAAGVKGKCIPRMKSSSSNSKQAKKP